jgi:hypothetical protein
MRDPCTVLGNVSYGFEWGWRLGRGGIAVQLSDGVWHGNGWGREPEQACRQVAAGVAGLWQRALAVDPTRIPRWQHNDPGCVWDTQPAASLVAGAMVAVACKVQSAAVVKGSWLTASCLKQWPHGGELVMDLDGQVPNTRHPTFLDKDEGKPCVRVVL